MSSKELMVSGKPLSSLRVVDLKEELEKRGLSKSGSKKDLAERLKQRLLIENQRESQKNATNEDELPNMSMRNQLSEQNPFIQEYFQSQAELFHSQKVVKKLYEGMSHSSEEQQQEQQQQTTEPPPSAPPPPVVEEEKQPEEIKEPEKQPEEIKEPEKQPEEIKEPEKQPEEIKEPEKLPEEIKEPEKEPEQVIQKEEVTQQKPSVVPPSPEKIKEKVSKTEEEKEEIPEPQQKIVQAEVIVKPVPVTEKVEIPNEKEKRQSSPPPPPPPVVLKRESPRKSPRKEQQQQQVVVEEEKKPTKQVEQKQEEEEEEEEEEEIQLKTSESEIEKLNEDITISKNKPQQQQQQQKEEQLDVGEVDVGLQIHKEESSSESEEEEEEEEEESEEEEVIKMKVDESSEESESEEGEAEEEDIEPPPAKKRLEEENENKKESNNLDKISISQEPSEVILKQNKEITKSTITPPVDSITTSSLTTTTSNVSTTIKRKRAIQSEDVEEEVLDYGDEDSKTKKESEEVTWNRRILRLKNRCAVVEKLDKKWNRGDRKPIVVTSKILQDFFPDVKLLSDTELKLEEKPHVEPDTEIEKRTKESEGSVEVPMDQEAETNLNQDNSSEPNVVNVKRKISIIPFEETIKELTPPLNQPSNYLNITNLVRPFTLLQLKEMLQRTGTIEDIWVDKIKSKCIAKFEKQEEAEETRAALHGIRWPSSNPKSLIVDFTDEATFEDHRGRTKDNNLITSHSNNNNSNAAVDSKSNVKIEKPSAAKGNIPVREWDLGKRSRSRSRDRRRRSTSQDRKRIRRSNSPRHDKKLTRDNETKAEEATGKALDELFRKTITTPCIYWLPLTPEQIGEKEEMRRKRMIERERRIQEIEKASKLHIRPR